MNEGYVFVGVLTQVFVQGIMEKKTRGQKEKFRGKDIRTKNPRVEFEQNSVKRVLGIGEGKIIVCRFAWSLFNSMLK